MALNHPFFAWFWVYNPPKINGAQMGGPKYVNQIYQLRYFDPPNYGQGLMIFKTQSMALNHPFFAWFWVYNPPKINGAQMGGPKYVNQIYQLRYFDPPNYGQGPMIF